MKPLIICLAIFSVFPSSSRAEDPVMLGLRSAMNAFAPIPPETSHTIRATAAEMLARYVTKRNNSLLSQLNFGASRVWIEMSGLQLTHVTMGAVTQADQANGILEKYTVLVDCEMYRTYDASAFTWTKWHNGRNPFMPPVINVERQTNGQWIARAPSSPAMVAQSSKGDPSIIPHGAAPPQHPAIALQIAPRPAPTAKTPASPGTGNPGNTATEPSGSWTGIFILLMIVSALGAFLKAIKPKKASRNRKLSNRSGNVMLPPLSFKTANTQPPPLPPSALTQDINPIDLMQRKENLMTPAEQAFFAVLEPIVRSSCMVSSKVRLADLFDVRQARGQQAAFNKICSKHIDFVLTEPGTSRILCGIELDDSSHNRPNRIERDSFVNELFAANHLPLLRVPVAWTYYPDGLRVELLKAGVSVSSAA